MSFSGCQINPIDVNFHLKRSLEIVDTKSEDKIWSKKDKEIKMSPLMPNRVNCTHQDWQIKVSDLHCFLIFRTFAEKLLHCVFALGLFDLCHSYYIVQFGGFTCAISQVFLSDTVSIFVRALHLSERHSIDIGTLRP